MNEINQNLPRKGERKKSGTLLKWWTKGWNSGMACRSLGTSRQNCFPSFDFSASVDRWGVLMKRGETERPVPARAKPGLWVSVSLSPDGLLSGLFRVDACEAGCLQYAYGGLCRADLVKSSSHQQADSATPWKHLPERPNLSSHLVCPAHTIHLKCLRSKNGKKFGCRGLRIWPCAVKCKWCQQVHCGIWGQLYI